MYWTIPAHPFLFLEKDAQPDDASVGKEGMNQGDPSKETTSWMGVCVGVMPFLIPCISRTDRKAKKQPYLNIHPCFKPCSHVSRIFPHGSASTSSFLLRIKADVVTPRPSPVTGEEVSLFSGECPSGKDPSPGAGGPCVHDDTSAFSV